MIGKHVDFDVCGVTVVSFLFEINDHKEMRTHEKVVEENFSNSLIIHQVKTKKTYHKR